MKTKYLSFSKMFTRRRTKLLLVVLVTIVMSITLIINLPETNKIQMAINYYWNTADKIENSFGFRTARDISQQLRSIHRSLARAMTNKLPPTAVDLRKIRDIVTNLNPAEDLDDGNDYGKDPTAKRVTKSLLVCPEYYSGSRTGGWKTRSCSYNQSIQDLVTVVIDTSDYDDLNGSRQIVQLIRDFRDAYDNITIVVIGDDNLTTKVKLKSRNGVVILLTSIQEIKTRYTLIARDMFHFSKTEESLERLIRILSETRGVAAVGGAVLNSSRHWKVGCFQSKINNYVLEYHKGYDKSKNECMYCDYVDGPFLIESDIFKDMGSIFSNSKNPKTDLIFQDFFLSLSEKQLVMNCPDVMFRADARLTDDARLRQRSTWLRFARKWELNRILLTFPSSRVLHKFTCKDVGISCRDKIKQTWSYAVPVCCQEEFANALAIWERFCEENKIRYEFNSGSVLGAIKMADLLPWDLDGDLAFIDTNYTFIKNMAPFFEKHGLKLLEFEDPSTKKGPYFSLWTPDMCVEAWGIKALTYDTVLDERRGHEEFTKIQIHGVWVNSVPNPGKYSRDRYGIECLRHAHSWIHTRKKSSWESYEAGKFQNCANPHRHSCLDRFPTDGSIAFQVPEY